MAIERASSAIVAHSISNPNSHAINSAGNPGLQGFGKAYSKREPEHGRVLHPREIQAGFRRAPSSTSTAPRTSCSPPLENLPLISHGFKTKVKAGNFVNDDARLRTSCSAGSAGDDTGNYACESGLCKPLGCKTDHDCENTFVGVAWADSADLTPVEIRPTARLVAPPVVRTIRFVFIQAAAARSSRARHLLRRVPEWMDLHVILLSAWKLRTGMPTATVHATGTVLRGRAGWLPSRSDVQLSSPQHLRTTGRAIRRRMQLRDRSPGHPHVRLTPNRLRASRKSLCARGAPGFAAFHLSLEDEV
jgi:hypothetical protein